MLNGISFFMCLGELGFPKDGGGRFSIVFPLLVLFSLIAAQVVFQKLKVLMARVSIVTDAFCYCYGGHMPND